MNESLTIETAGLSLQNEKPLEGALAFLASRSKKSVRELSESAGEVFKGFAGVLDQLLTTIIEKRTAAEFHAAFVEAFPKYVAITVSLSHFAQAVVPASVIQRLTRESICELEADFRDKALLAFGAATRDQAMFTIWTMRKVNDLLVQISTAKLEESRQKEDREFCAEFNFNALRAHFSLDCLNMALRLQRPIYPEVMAELNDGLRSMVNAYAWVRRGAALRIPVAEPPLEVSASDEENEQLLSASMRDMVEMAEDEALPNAD